MSVRSLVLGFASFLLFAPSVISAQPAQQAQQAGTGMHDCGTDCIFCAFRYWEGQNHSSLFGIYDMHCGWATVGCRIEGCGMGSVNEDLIPADVVAEAIESAEISELEDVVSAYGERLLLAVPRGAVAIRGSACSAEQVTRLVFVSHAKLETLRALSVANLEEVDL